MPAAITSSAGQGANLPPDLAGTNYMAIAEYLLHHGYSAAAAAGITGTIAGESGGNPESEGSGGRGLIGWTPIGKLPNSAFTGNESADLQAQLQQVLIYNQDQGAALNASLAAQKNPIAAADMYSASFERPAVTYSDVRPQIVESVYGQLTGQPTSGTYNVPASVASSSGATATTTSAVTGTGNFYTFLNDLLNPKTSSSGGSFWDIIPGVGSAISVADEIPNLIKAGLVRLGLSMVGIIMFGSGLLMIGLDPILGVLKNPTTRKVAEMAAA